MEWTHGHVHLSLMTKVSHMAKPKVKEPLEWEKWQSLTAKGGGTGKSNGGQ